MKNTHLLIAILAVAATIINTGCPNPPIPPAGPTCKSFDSMPAAQYSQAGTPSYPPGSVILSLGGGLVARIQQINLPGVTTPGMVAVEAAPASLGYGMVVSTNNACIEFDFSGLVVNIQSVSIEFLDKGGKENLAVNGVSYAGELAGAPAMLGGASINVSSTPIPGGNKGKLTITSTTNINKLKIGGQEFSLDNLCYQ